MLSAGRIGRIFRVDPVLLLSDGGDDFLTCVREAAANVVNEDERKAAEEQERKAKSGRSGGAGRRPSRGRRR